jgi:hypothetical protein
VTATVAVGADQINAKWYPGREVRHHTHGHGHVISNRIYATDCGAYVDFGPAGSGLVHWSELEPLGEDTP